MPAVRALVRLFDLDESEGTITALDSYGPDTHIGTSCGQLLRLSLSVAKRPGQSRRKTHAEDARQEDNTAAAAANAEDDGATIVSVTRRCFISPGGAAAAAPVQQLQHSRGQRFLFALCAGRLLLLHAETYAVLCTIATDVAAFSVAQPMPTVGRDHELSGSVSPAVAASLCSSTAHVRPLQLGRSTREEEDGVSQHSRTTSHVRTPSDASHTSSQAWTPRSTLGTTSADLTYTSAAHSPRPAALPPLSGTASPFAVPVAGGSGGGVGGAGRTHVVCVAERHKKELAVYVVDRVYTSSSSSSASAAATGVLAAASAATSPATSAVAQNPAQVPSADASPPLSAAVATALALPPPRVALRQRYMLPEPAQSVLLCDPVAALRRDPASSPASAAGSAPAGDDGGLASAGAVEAGLTVCVGMRREVSLLSLLGGSPWCVLRLDGSRPPLVSVGSDHNTFLVRTQAPNTVMEIGVPPAAATAGCAPVALADRACSSYTAAAAGVNPITVRTGALRAAQLAPAAGTSRGRDDDLVMGDVFQTDGPVELVLARFPHVFLFTSRHCDVVPLLDDGSSNGSDPAATAFSPPLSASSASWGQRVPVPGIRFGALRGHGESFCVASERTVWALKLSPLRVQLAELVANGNSAGAFQLLAFHRQRVEQAARSAAAATEAAEALRQVEGDLCRMAGFAALHRGHVAEAIAYLRGHIDPREVLLSLPDCIPPMASLAPPNAPADASPAELRAPVRLDACVLDHVVTSASLDAYGKLLRGYGVAAEARPPTSASPPYWDGWHAPCVYNSFGGDVVQAWRTAYAALQVGPSTAAAGDNGAEAFVASRFDFLKAEVRTWFAEELAADHAHACGDLSTSGEEMNDDGVAGAARGRVAVAGRASCDGCCVCPSSSARPTTAPLVGGAAWAATSLASLRLATARRRAMEYASLVLAWQARDYRMAHCVVASLSRTMHVEDCAPLLRQLQEHRLLAVLQFRAGCGGACRGTLREAVSVAAVLRPLRRCTAPRPAAPVSSAALRSEIAAWRTRMMARAGLQGRRPGGGDDGAAVAAAQHAHPTCGCGLLSLPSLGAVARVARTLFGVGDGTSATEALVDAVCAYYGGYHDGRAPADGGPFLELCYASGDAGAAARCFSFPHTGPLLLYADEGPARDGAPDARDGERPEPFTQEPVAASRALSHSVVRVVPTSLTQFLYLVEKLDVVGVRLLLRREPRLATLRDEEGNSALHVALAQLGGVGCSVSRAEPHAVAADALVAWQTAVLQLLCALVELLAHAGCPAGALNCCGWSCLDVAAVACGGNRTVFDVVTAALLAAVEVRAAEVQD